MNRVILIGRLTKDPDLRYTSSGRAVANFTLAVNRPFRNAQGKNEADFINCQTWRKQAENLATYMKKGNLIGVDGRIQTRTYENQEGKTVFVTEVLAESIQFLESRNTSEKPNRSKQQAIDTANDMVRNSVETKDVQDDDLPF